LRFGLLGCIACLMLFAFGIVCHVYVGGGGVGIGFTEGRFVIVGLEEYPETLGWQTGRSIKKPLGLGMDDRFQIRVPTALHELRELWAWYVPLWIPSAGFVAVVLLARFSAPRAVGFLAALGSADIATSRLAATAGSIASARARQRALHLATLIGAVMFAVALHVGLWCILHVGLWLLFGPNSDWPDWLSQAWIFPGGPLLGCLWLGLFLRLADRRARLDASSHCVCGYNLTGNVSGRCPECGMDIDPQAREAAQAPPPP